MEIDPEIAMDQKSQLQKGILVRETADVLSE